MNGIHQNVENHNFEKMFPGCLGRMVNLFDLNVGVSTNGLLTDRPHLEGSSLSRSRSDVTRMSPSGDQMEEKEIVSEIRNSHSTRKSNGTPMKTLIAQEMSKDVDSRRSPPNVIAKLMGLDTLPRPETDTSIPRYHSRRHPRSHSDIPMGYWEQQNGFFHDIQSNEFKDVYETLQKSPNNGRYDETSNDKRMALVRQKFIEAKRLSMDEKLRQSKQFQDALEVLNSNKDLFLKCLQEPNSMFSQNLYSLQSVPPPPELKRITVLRPSKVANSNDFSGAGTNDGKQFQKGTFFLLNRLEKSQLVDSSPARWKNYESPSQATRIVVLKPSPVKSHDDVKTEISPRIESPSRINGDDFFGDVEDDENQESREVAKAITQQMREKLRRHHHDEALMSSVFSNGYVGDESSFNKSEIEYVAGNLSDSEVLSPLSRHSWDYVNRLGSPFSTSSFGRVSFSPESSVCREAKKRLSERWAMMASNGSCQEQTYTRRISSTLGEMLALSETKKAAMPGKEGNLNKEPEGSNSLINNGPEPSESMNHSPRNLLRSKSVPVSFTEYGTRLSTSTSVPEKGKAEAPKDETKERIVKSSFKGKMSSLFSLRNKKASKDKSLESETKDECHSNIVPGQMGCYRSEGLTDEGFQHCSPGQCKPSNKASSSNQVGEFGATCPETALSMGKPITFGNSGENLDQPSPISVLDTPFEEDEHAASVFPHYVKPDRHGVELPVNPVRSNLIDKSPPIGSIARTLTWDDSCMDTTSRYSPNQSFSGQGTEEEKREWFFFVKTLLSVSDLQGEVQSNSFLARWHSPDSPLDPSLRDRYIDLKDKETVHEAKRRLKRSTRKLVFDCVNAVLVEIAGYGMVSGQRAIPCVKSHSILRNTTITMLDEVWNRTNVWLSGEIKGVSDDCGDDNSLVLERVVRKEVVGKGWIDHLILETDNLGKEIEGKLLEELVEEAVVEFTGRV